MPTILVTRPQPDAEDSAAHLQALGFDTLIAPMLDMQVLPAALPQPDGLGAIALTSANAVRALEASSNLVPYLHLPVFTVGGRTAITAREAGFADVVSAEGALPELAAVLTDARVSAPVFHPAGRHSAGSLAAAVGAAAEVITVQVYEMVAATRVADDIAARLVEGSIDAASFYSRRTSETFCALTGDLIPDKVRKEIEMLCLSEKVAEPLFEHHFARIALADGPTEEAMMTLALSFLRDQIRP